MNLFSTVLLIGCVAHQAAASNVALSAFNVMALTIPLLTATPQATPPAPPPDGAAPAPPPDGGAPPAADDQSKVCWIKTYGRGVGKVPNHRYCSNSEHVIQSSLCYKKCPKGYTGRGPVCWKGIKSSRRGAGKAIKIGCKPGKTKDAGLCYTRCKEGYKGVGPVCWANKCPKDYPCKCGLICAKDKQECMVALKEIMGGSVSAAREAMSNPISLMNNAIRMAKMLAEYPSCASPNKKMKRKSPAEGPGDAKGGDKQLAEMSAELGMVKGTLDAIAKKLGVQVPPPPPVKEDPPPAAKAPCKSKAPQEKADEAVAPQEKTGEDAPQEKAPEKTEVAPTPQEKTSEGTPQEKTPQDKSESAPEAVTPQ
jgi:hypothetical protein